MQGSNYAEGVVSEMENNINFEMQGSNYAEEAVYEP